MPKNETASDKLKKLFAEHGGGNEQDWKRLPKRKDAEGHWVRQFENRKCGLILEAVELADGSFKISPLAAAANSAFSKPPETGQGASAGMDLAKNEAADKVIAALCGDGDADEVDERQVKKAGRALAGRFTFAVTDKDAEDMEASFYAIITPTKYWKETGFCFDQPSPIGHLLPSGEDGNDCGTWVFEKEYRSAQELAKDLQKRGFVWDRGFQDFIDNKFTAALAPAAATPTPLPKPGL